MPQVIVFDLEYGQPAASTPVPASRAPLEDLLGCYGHAGLRLGPCGLLQEQTGVLVGLLGCYGQAGVPAVACWAVAGIWVC